MAGPTISSEEELIARYLAPLAQGHAGAFGLADDCATIAPAPGCELVLKTDPVIAGVHFLPDDAPADIAWKALAVNVSDLAAKGATPRIYLMALALPAVPEASWLAAFADGLAQAQARFGIVLAGGDTDLTPGPLSIGITAIGEVPAGRLVRRSGARPGDRLFVSGTIGDAALGLAARRGAVAAGWHGLAPEDLAVLIARYLRPTPRLGLQAALRDHATGAMDISDGLVKDAARMARAAGVRLTVRLDDVPLSAPAARYVGADLDRRIELATGGDDYEILAAVAPAQVDAFVHAAAQAGERVTLIGEFASGAPGLELVAPDGRLIPTPAYGGWDHLARKA